jgi:hypothetical protein
MKKGAAQPIVVDNFEDENTEDAELEPSLVSSDAEVGEQSGTAEKVPSDAEVGDKRL